MVVVAPRPAPRPTRDPPRDLPESRPATGDQVVARNIEFVVPAGAALRYAACSVRLSVIMSNGFDSELTRSRHPCSVCLRARSGLRMTRRRAPRPKQATGLHILLFLILPLLIGRACRNDLLLSWRAHHSDASSAHIFSHRQQKGEEGEWVT